MILDIIFIGCLIWGFTLGYRKGLIHSLVFLLAIAVGVVAALKCSYLLAGQLNNWFSINSEYLPVISFVATFVLAVGGVVFIGKFVEGIVKAVQLNFINKLAGAAIWSVVSLFVLSTLFWYAEKYGLITDALKQSSSTYNMIAVISPAVISTIGNIFPFLHDLYEAIASQINEWAGSAPDLIIPD